MQNTCLTCGLTYRITPEDNAFRDAMSPVFGEKKYSFPAPLQCPQCRRKHRLQFRNERHLYKRKCDLTGKEIISNYSEDKPHVVYDRSVWWSDRFDPLAFGRDFDFSRPFFDQFHEMILRTPVFALSASPDAEENNCLYVNFASHNKNCYMIFDSDASEDCYYSNVIKHSRQCIDCSNIEHSELCYDSVDCKRCYDVRYSQYCDNCSDSAFLKNCISCKHCLFCMNLMQKEYHIQNKPVSREEFERAMETLRDWTNVEAARSAFTLFCLGLPERATHQLNVENCTGDYIANSRNIRESFDIGEAEDIANCDALYRAKSCQDVSSFGEKIERIYNSGTIGFDCYNVACSFACRTNCADMFYCFNCYRSHDCFGCASLKNHRYCVFNKQYTKEEYERLTGQILSHMQSTGEIGKFFPVELSPFAYNETVAQEYFPLTVAEAKAMGKRWQLEEEGTKGKETMAWETVPTDIADVPASITGAILSCSEGGRNFRITEQELSFYKDRGIPLPQLHPDERHKRRMALRSPRELRTRPCMKCGTEMQTAYSAERPEIVYCESCYLSSVY